MIFYDLYNQFVTYIILVSSSGCRTRKNILGESRWRWHKLKLWATVVSLNNLRRNFLKCRKSSLNLKKKTIISSHANLSTSGRIFVGTQAIQDNSLSLWMQILSMANQNNFSMILLRGKIFKSSIKEFMNFLRDFQSIRN